MFSVIDRFDEEEFPLAVMYSLTYQGKRMLSESKCLYQVHYKIFNDGHLKSYEVLNDPKI